MPKLHWTDPAQLCKRMAKARAPTIIDVRRTAAVKANSRLIAGARWRDHTATGSWMRDLDPGQDVIVYCVHGHNVSQSAAAILRDGGFSASALRGGIEAYLQAGGVTVKWHDAVHSARTRACWVTAESNDDHAWPLRMACTWLIRRFISPDAQILYVAAEQIGAIAEEFSGIAFDAGSTDGPGAQDERALDALMRDFDLHDPALERLAQIVRAAAGEQSAAPQAGGLQALCRGIAQMHAHSNDSAIMQHSLVLYDALYAWCHQHDRPPA